MIKKLNLNFVNVKPQKNIFKFTFKNIVNITDFPVLNTYLKESLCSINNLNLKEIQVKIIESIQKSDASIILCDDFVGRKNFCMLGIMNRILKNKKTEISDKEEDFFLNPIKIYENQIREHKKNLEKANLNPHGALIICQKFEFATQYYRICRKFDYKNQLRCVRVGTSLHTVAPTVELDVKYNITIVGKRGTQ
jgi:hypothetical protein